MLSVSIVSVPLISETETGDEGRGVKNSGEARGGDWQSHCNRGPGSE